MVHSLTQNRVVRHSLLVAQASSMIAQKCMIDRELAYLCGLFHDIGKFFVKHQYEHPMKGFEIFNQSDKNIANACISHPFPNFSDLQYITFFCKNDKLFAEKIHKTLSTINHDDYIKIVQISDKLSSDNGYLPITEKFSWYRERYQTPKDIEQNLMASYMKIINEIEHKYNISIYDVLNIKC